MAKNISDNETTIKNMMIATSNDLWDTNRTMEYCIYNKYQIEDDNILNDYSDYFDRELITIALDEEFYYSPTRFSEYYYGTSGLDWLVLYFAKIPSLFDFNKPNITVLPKEKLSEINSLMNFKKNIVEDSYKNPTKYN